MNLLVRLLAMLQIALLGVASACAQTSSLSGSLDVTASFANGASSASMTLNETGGAV